MKPFLRRLTPVLYSFINSSKKTKGIVVGVLCVMMFCVFTGITLASRVVYIKDGSNVYVAYTFSRDPENILKSKDIVLSDADKFEYNEIDDDKSEIIVTRAFDVNVTVDGSTKAVMLADGTVEDAIKTANVTLSEQDRVNVALGEPVHDESNIVIDRVSVKNVNKKSEIKFKSVTRKTSSLLKGERVVKVKGKNGVAVSITENIVVNGKVESCTFIKKKTVKKPVTQVVLVGTKPAIGVDKISGAGEIKYKGKILKYSKKLVGSGTAYSARKGAGTASGRIAKRGNVAVNPKVIPYGTKMFIKTEGGYIYGVAVAADTGTALRTGKAVVDLYFDTYNQCCQFGRRQVEVYILK